MDPRALILTLAILLGGLLLYGAAAWILSRTRGPAADLPDPGAVYERNPEASTSIRDGQVVLSLPVSAHGLVLNPVALRCWELMDGASSLREIAQSLAREYGQDIGVMLNEVCRLAARLRRDFYVLRDDEWRLAHTHFCEIFGGVQEEGISERRPRERMILHVATDALGPDGNMDLSSLRFPHGARRRRALASFSRHVEHETSRREALRAFESAWEHSAEGRFEAAERSFLDACRLVPEWVDAHYQLGYLYMRTGQFDKAMVQLEQTEKLSPGYHQAREYLALAPKLADGRITLEAFQLIERATSSDTVDADTMISMCRSAIDLSPGFAAAHLELGRALERKKEFGAALASFRSAIDSDPDGATLCNALYGRGSVFMATGRIEQALKEFEKVIQIDGSPQATRSAMAHLASTDSVH